MMTNKKGTAPNTSVGADEGQSQNKIHTEIITDFPQQNNLETVEDLQKRQVSTPVVKGELDVISMDELYDTAYPPKIPIVDGMIYCGTYLFVGAPKVGKSFFMAQLGYHVSTGQPFLGFPVQQGTVLYLALEDDFSRLQKRLSRMFGTESTENFFFATKAKTLNEGLDEQLNQFVKEHKDARLIIIDTLQKVKEVGGDKFSYANDYEIVTKLKRFSDEHGICLLVVHHTRKMESTDSFDMISGSNGLLGAADGAFVMLKEKRTENKAILEVAGRDQQDMRFQLNFDRERCLWELMKAETELWKEPVDNVLEAIAKIVTEESPEWSGTASELLEHLPDVEMKPNTLTRKLNINTERLLLDYKIHYESRRDHNGRRIYLKLKIE
ncbi:MAG: helicase RepA family protein [Hespellia sp.]|nr:helicase RepA family protein [Hespellia sp.]